jgi:quercetin dioxygenase-like cupin family protein
MAQRKGITLFRAADAPNLEATDMMSVPQFPADFVRPESGRTEDIVSGQTVKVLYRQSEEEGGFSLVYAWFKPHFPLPRHSHSADCLYYVIAGSAVMGNQTLKAGDGFFVPSGAPYQYSAGPEGVEVLEFRHARSFDMQITESNERYANIFEVAAKCAPQWAAMAAPAPR